jgi:hypothetical protein
MILNGGLTAQRPYVTQPASEKLLRKARDEQWQLGLENVEISENQSWTKIRSSPSKRELSEQGNA